MESKVSTKQTLADTTENYYYERIYSLIEIFNARNSTHEDELNLIIDNCKDFERNRTYFHHEDALTIVHDFFKNTDSEIFKYFLELYKNRCNLIKFSVDPYFVSNEVIGNYFFVDIVRKNFIYVEDCVGIDKLVTLAHECGHAIAHLYQPKKQLVHKIAF